MKPIVTHDTMIVTGAGGFIGSNLVRKLLKLDKKVHVIWKKSSSDWRLKDIKHKIIFHNINLLQENSLKRLMQTVKPSAIFHLATHSSYRNQDDVEKMIDVSINGTLNLLLASLTIPYTIFVNTGSSSEYGFKKKPMKESDLLEPISFYAAAKASSTLLCQAFAYHYKKPIVTFRPFSVYGPYEEKERFIPTIIKKLINKNPIQLTSGKQRRDFIYVDDVVEAYVKSIDRGDKLVGKICNIGSGNQYTNDDVVRTFFRTTKKHVPIEKGAFPLRMWDSPYWVADISKSTKLLRWKPRHTLSDGLLKTYKWFVKHKNFYE